MDIDSAIQKCEELFPIQAIFVCKKIFSVRGKKEKKKNTVQTIF